MSNYFFVNHFIFKKQESLSFYSDVIKIKNKHVIQIQVSVTIQLSVKFKTVQFSNKQMNDL